MDVFNTFIELLRQTGNVTKGQIDTNESRQVLDIFQVLCIYLLFGLKLVFGLCNLNVWW